MKRAQASRRIPPKPWSSIGTRVRGRLLRAVSILGGMYYTGIGIRQDAVKARELVRQACEGKNARGCAWLGLV